MTFLENGLFIYISHNIHIGRKNKSVQEEVPLIKRFGLFITWLQPIAIVTLSVSRPAILFLSLLHYFEHFALKSPIRIQEGSWLLFILVARRFSSEQKLWSSSWSLMINDKGIVWNKYKRLHVCCY